MRENLLANVSDDALWGMKPIANFLGCSTDYLAKLMDRTDIPVTRIDGRRCFALKTVLRAWILEKGLTNGR